MNVKKLDRSLAKLLRSGQFVVTAELSPPDSANPDDVLAAAKQLAGFSDALNVTDAAGANCHISGFGACVLLTQAGYEVVFQMTCRDRNRIALQGDLLGASAVGFKNVLCLTGDDVTIGDHPQAKRVFDFDSIQLLRTAKTMRDEGIFLSGRKLSTPPSLFLGAAANPFVEPFDFRPLRLAKKIQAGADFIQTQYCFDIQRFRSFMEQVRDLGLHEKCFIIVGLGPLRSEKSAEFLRTRIPGVVIPDAMITRMRKAPLSKKRAEGKKICIETIQQIKETKGVAGVHMMAYRQEEVAGEIIEEAGLFPRPGKEYLN
jgi:methylenetetrahydrofolate reductase (NADPH)